MRKSPIFMVMAGALAASALTSAAWSQAGGRIFERMDRNGDGVVEAAEIQEMRGELYAAKARFRKRATGQSASLFERADGDGDGQVSRDEFVNVEPLMFQRADADGDGKLTRDEMSTFREQLRQAQ